MSYRIPARIPLRALNVCHSFCRSSAHSQNTRQQCQGSMPLTPSTSKVLCIRKHRMCIRKHPEAQKQAPSACAVSPLPPLAWQCQGQPSQRRSRAGPAACGGGTEHEGRSLNAASKETMRSGRRSGGTTSVPPPKAPAPPSLTHHMSGAAFNHAWALALHSGMRTQGG